MPSLLETEDVKSGASRVVERLRIAHVLFSSHLAGSERYCVDLANRQAALGHEVHVVGQDNAPFSRALTNLVRFHGIKLRLFRGLQVHRLVAGLDVDLCHGHLSVACKILGAFPHQIPRVATLHVGYKAQQHARLDGLICVNRAQQGRLSGYKGRVCVIPNWLPMAPANSARPGSLRQMMGLKADVFLVGTVGRLHPSKGMDVLIASFRAAALPGAELVIIGAGPQRGKLEKLRAGDPRIHLLGYHANVYDCLSDFSLFVSPSREESFGLAILEAMSTGVPVIATAAEGPREFLRGQPVELLAPGSIPALTVALSEAYARFRAGQLPRLDYDLSRFDPAASMADITCFYRGLIAVKRFELFNSLALLAAAT